MKIIELYSKYVQRDFFFSFHIPSLKIQQIQLSTLAFRITQINPISKAVPKKEVHNNIHIKKTTEHEYFVLFTHYDLSNSSVPLFFRFPPKQPGPGVSDLSLQFILFLTPALII